MLPNIAESSTDKPVFFSFRPKIIQSGAQQSYVRQQPEYAIGGQPVKENIMSPVKPWLLLV